MISPSWPDVKIERHDSGVIYFTTVYQGYEYELVLLPSVKEASFKSPIGADRWDPDRPDPELIDRIFANARMEALL